MELDWLLRWRERWWCLGARYFCKQRWLPAIYFGDNSACNWSRCCGGCDHKHSRQQRQWLHWRRPDRIQLSVQQIRGRYRGGYSRLIRQELRRDCHLGSHYRVSYCRQHDPDNYKLSPVARHSAWPAWLRRNAITACLWHGWPRLRRS